MNNETAELINRMSLRELVDNYAITVDRRDTDNFVDLFMPDGVLSIYEPGVADAVVTFTGPDELRTVHNLLQNFVNTFHVMANHLCDINGETASGSVYCLANHLVENEAEITNLCMYIRYDDTYTLTTDGWRFKHRKVMRQWTEERPAELKPLDLSGVEK